VPVIATSGLVQARPGQARTVFLHKPLDLDELLGKVDRCLAARTGGAGPNHGRAP
jgi:hypothetical protein